MPISTILPKDNFRSNHNYKFINPFKNLTAEIMKPIKQHQLFTASCLSLLVTSLSFSICIGTVT